MPELPEVETIRRGLSLVMGGRRIVRAHTRRADLRWPLPEDMPNRLADARIEKLGRVAKYMLLELSSGETLVVHLGMTGKFRIEDKLHAEDSRSRHDHVMFELDNGVRIVYNDPRRFGMMDLVDTEAIESHRLFQGLGPEPLGNGFHEEYLKQALTHRNTAIKLALLDQRTVAGLGNIYVNEALWRSGISPFRRARRIAFRRVAALTQSIREVLVEAIEAGGSSLRDYRTAEGDLGYFQHRFQVYGREGKPCLTSVCEGTVRRKAQSGRSTFYCQKCQR